ncbi:MAG: bifunctional homocysteine S-methyltransferase/methylenetetrahydrofolate reductase [Desulfobulbaceae bacterium A2]|nr:MAG: bifunctional homocysteine S-methyltransferase/methylenetetrahydrofolate reductase [Desulfobulbaceae bacterium A2]
MKQDFLATLAERVLLGDGAMGTYLYAKGVERGQVIERLNLSEPDLVYGVHEEYIRAGSQLIETNTFGANRFRLQLGAEQVREINRVGATLARRAAGSGVYVAGSVGPSGIEFPLEHGEIGAGDVKEAFAEQIGGLLEGGIDVLQLETFGSLDEMLLALTVARRLCDLPIISQMVYPAGGRTPDGVEALTCARAALAGGANVVGSNCGRGVQPMLVALEQLGALRGIAPLSAFANAGFPEVVGHRLVYPADPAYMARMLKEAVRLGVRLVGGCCGTTPVHIQELQHLLHVKKRTVAVLEPAAPTETSPEAEARPRGPGALLRGLADGSGLPLVVELDPPTHLDLAGVLEGARALAGAGVDVISLAENPLAILRSDNLSLAHRIRQEQQLPVILHLTCRDRNVLGLQNQIMSAHHLGLDSILAITGDPAASSDQPGVSGVFDVQSFGLVRMISQFNQGRNFAGKDLRGHTDFSIGVAFSYRPQRPETQLSRLEKKAALGAHYAMTQPFFDADEVEQMMEQAARINLPIFPGIFPLISARNAEFLHNELPGISIPAWIRERLGSFEQVEDQRKAAMEITRGLIEKMATFVDGLYLISPLNKWQITAQLAGEIRLAGWRGSGRLRQK